MPRRCYVHIICTHSALHICSCSILKHTCIVCFRLSCNITRARCKDRLDHEEMFRPKEMFRPRPGFGQRKCFGQDQTCISQIGTETLPSLEDNVTSLPSRQLAIIVKTWQMDLHIPIDWQSRSWDCGVAPLNRIDSFDTSHHGVAIRRFLLRLGQRARPPKHLLGAFITYAWAAVQLGAITSVERS